MPGSSPGSKQTARRLQAVAPGASPELADHDYLMIGSHSHGMNPIGQMGNKEVMGLATDPRSEPLAPQAKKPGLDQRAIVPPAASETQVGPEIDSESDSATRLLPREVILDSSSQQDVIHKHRHPILLMIAGDQVGRRRYAPACPMATPNPAWRIMGMSLTSSPTAQISCGSILQSFAR